MAGAAFAAGDRVLLRDLPDASGANGLSGTLVKEAGKGKWVVRVAGEERSRILATSNLQRCSTSLAESYSIVGSWDDWSAHEMTWNPASSCYEYHLQLVNGFESFRILVHGDWDRCLYPDREQANPYEDHSLLGPDDGGLDFEWTVGLRQEDKADLDGVFTIKLLISPDGSPARVTWAPERRAAAEAVPTRPERPRFAQWRAGLGDPGAGGTSSQPAVEEAVAPAASGRRSRSRARGFEAWQELRDAAGPGSGAAVGSGSTGAAAGEGAGGEAAQLLPGDTVEISGLRSRLGPSLNGQRGLVTRRLGGGGRFEVHVGPDILPSCFVSVRSGNLTRCSTQARKEPLELEKFMEKPLLCTDAAGIPRGGCKRCGRCRHWVLRCCSDIYFTRQEEKDTVDADDGEVHNGDLATETKTVTEQDSCEHCGCPAEEHESLKQWLDRVRSRAKAVQACSQTGAWRPKASLEASRLPPAMAEWPASAAALFALTEGRFDPVASGREPEEEEASGNRQRSLVSIICPTDDRKQMFHPLLYECFRAQTHEARELIVVDAGNQPCAFLSARAQEDPRVVYRHFPAKAQEGNWSCGLKRNIACHLSRGSIIVHFNAGDIYAPGYLSLVHSELLAMAAGAGGDTALGPAATQLSQWHAVNLSKQSRCTQLLWVDLRNRGSRLQQMLSGNGCTFAYTRAAWEAAPFPDAEAPEDCRFMEALFRRGVPIRVVQPKASSAKRDGLVAHCFEREAGANSGEDELASLMQLCELQDEVPSAFRRSWPFVREAVSRLNQEDEAVAPRILQIEGSTYLCAQCTELVASLEHLADTSKHTEDRRSVEVGQFTQVEGVTDEIVPGRGRYGRAYESTWFPGWSSRTALCGGCGDRLGYRCERGGEQFWALDWSRLAERRPPGSESKLPVAKKKGVTCPAGHVLHRFANPGNYGCDSCALRGVYNIPPRGTWLWGCSKCDFDMCRSCWEGKRRTV